MLIKYSVVLFAAFLFTAILVFFFRKIALRKNLFIAQGIPLVGGISIGLSFIIVCLITFLAQKNLSWQLAGIMISSLIMLAFGLIDDWRELSINAKFFVQFVSTAILILFGVKTQIVYIGNILNIIITFIWVIGITNAINHLDVMDGLAAGTAIIISLSFFTLSFLGSDIKSAIFALALAGSALGFLIYNLPPAKVYMGNSGSHFLGFILSSIALLISYAPLERKIALLSPIIILGFPIFDTSFLILIRMTKKKLPFKKSNDHPALKFLALGYSKSKALIIMLLLCLFFSFSGILLSRLSNFLGIITVVLVAFVSLILTFKMAKIP